MTIKKKINFEGLIVQYDHSDKCGLPGTGFYNLAKDLGAVKPSVDHITFVVDELNRVQKQCL